MKALVYEGIKTLNIRDVAMPVPGDGEALVRVEAVGICGSDMHGYLGHDDRRPAPLILGHEAAGVIEGGPRDGTRVTVNPLVVDPACPTRATGRENISPNRQLISMPPREGAFAQYLVIPDENLVEVPDNVPFDKAALCEPLSVSWHAAKLGVQALHPSMDRHALILGGGAIGLAASLALKAMGFDAVSIVEPTAERAQVLADHGETVLSKAEGEWPLVVDAVGYEATRAAASAAAAPGGVILHIGLGSDAGGLDTRRMTLQEITFIGTYCYTPAEFRETAAALFDGRLGALDWFETRTLDDGAHAFADLLSHKVAAPKIVLSPWD